MLFVMYMGKQRFSVVQILFRTLKTGFPRYQNCFFFQKPVLTVETGLHVYSSNFGQVMIIFLVISRSSSVAAWTRAVTLFLKHFHDKKNI